MHAALAALGWNAAFERHFELHALQGLVPARVAVEHRNQYEVLAERGPLTAVLTGKQRRSTLTRRDRPAVGDWVAIVPPPADGVAVIHAVLPRISVFTRKMSGREQDEQIVAANIDVAFLLTSLNAELNLRRTERYLTLAWESGARPVIVLTKADRCDDPGARAREVATVAGDVPVLVTSAKTGEGVTEVGAALDGHRTGAMLGSSGVGKSTLLNALVGYERQETAEIREDDAHGRHTTTWRELVQLPGGGIVIDTPGMRELALSDAGHGLLAAFDDIEALAGECAFGNCRHGNEPGCAVRQAVDDGRLAPERLESFHKLARELLHRAQWENMRLAAEAKKKGRIIAKARRKFFKDEGR